MSLDLITFTAFFMRHRIHSAFTLIELMIVIAVIGILVGSIGLALKGGNKPAALQGAQSTLMSLVSAARAQAALESATATVLIWADADDSETYLRRAAVFVGVDTNNDGTLDYYLRKSEPLNLPAGIFFVPSDGGLAMPVIRQPVADWAGLKLTEAQNSNAPTGSLIFKRYDATAALVIDSEAPVKAYESIAFDSYGQLKSLVKGSTSNAVSYLAVAPGDIEPNQGVTFSEVDSLRGVKLSAYGIPLMLNEKNAFK